MNTKEESHTIGLISIQIDKYETCTTTFFKSKCHNKGVIYKIKFHFWHCNQVLNQSCIFCRFPHGNHDSVCGHVDVEEHESCTCDCPLRSEDCHHAIVGDTTSPHVDDKYFDSASCRCLCRNREVRHACISSGMDWDDSLCRCTCPKSR